jgi:hypothetical protein
VREKADGKRTEKKRRQKRKMKRKIQINSTEIHTF